MGFIRTFKKVNTIFNKILIICVGNICRSPTAERILQQELPSKIISSAGLNALTGKGMHSPAARVLSENGYDSENHEARKLNYEMVADSDLVLVMEKGHQNVLMNLYPEISGKVMLLGRWADDLEVTDPYRKSSEAYNYVYKQIENCCMDWKGRLMS